MYMSVQRLNNYILFRTGVQNSVETSAMCGISEKSVVRAASLTVDSRGVLPLLSAKLRRTFKGAEAACVQRSIEVMARGEICQK